MRHEPMIGLYRGKSLVSKAIRFQTRGEYSHVGIHFGDDVIEAWASGFFGGKVYHRRSGEGHKKGTPIDLFVFDYNKDKLEAANAWLLDQVGKKYDYRMVAGFVTRKRREAGLDKWFCSELGYTYLGLLDVPLFARSHAYEIDPNMMKRLPALKKAYTEISA